MNDCFSTPKQLASWSHLDWGVKDKFFPMEQSSGCLYQNNSLSAIPRCRNYLYSTCLMVPPLSQQQLSTRTFTRLQSQNLVRAPLIYYKWHNRTLWISGFVIRKAWLFSCHFLFDMAGESSFLPVEWHRQHPTTICTHKIPNSYKLLKSFRIIHIF